MWTIDVTMAEHDMVKIGILDQRVSRIHLSTAEFPNPLDAEVAAAQIALSIHLGMMATRITHCI